MPEILKHIGDLVSSSEITASKDTANEWTQYVPLGVLSEIPSLTRVYAFTPDFRFSTIVGDKSQEYCDEFNVDWDESWNDSVLNVYRSDLSTFSFGSTVITALFK